MALVIPLTVKVLAALSSFVPLAFTLEGLQQRMDAERLKLTRHPAFVISFAFGSAYAACGDVRASVYALVIAASFLTLYEDASGVSAQLMGPMEDTDDKED